MTLLTALEPLAVSTFTVALAEMGDKTQFLALLLACKFKRPWIIISGIFVATLANRTLASFAGQQLSLVINPQMLQWVLGLSFLLVAAWTLIPEKDQDDITISSRFGPFMTTVIACFLLEMGDKTQIATMMLGARYDNLPMVIAGSTLGMMITSVPVVFAGYKMATHLPINWVRGGASALFASLGVVTLAA